MRYLLVITALNLVLACRLFAQSDQAWRVGLVFRFGDKFNTSVEKFNRGIEAARLLFERENPGTKIQLIRYSQNDFADNPSASSPGLSSIVKAARKVIKDKIPVVIGAEFSEEAIVLGDLLSKSQIPLMTPSSSNPEVTLNKPYVFRACFSDDLVGDRLAEYTFNKLKPKNLAVLQNVSSPYTNFLSERFIMRIKELSLSSPENERPKIVVHKFLKRNFDFGAVVEDFQKNNTTHVAAFTHDMDMLNFVRQASVKKFAPIYITSDGWGSNEYVRRVFVKESPAGQSFVVYRNTYWKKDLVSPAADKFRLESFSRFHEQPSDWEAIAFDAAWMVFHAIKKSGKPSSGPAIRRAMTELEGLELVTTSALKFDDKNTPVKDLYLYRIDAKDIHDGIHFEGVLK